MHDRCKTWRISVHLTYWRSCQMVWKASNTVTWWSSSEWPSVDSRWGRRLDWTGALFYPFNWHSPTALSVVCGLRRWMKHDHLPSFSHSTDSTYWVPTMYKHHARCSGSSNEWNTHAPPLERAGSWLGEGTYQPRESRPQDLSSASEIEAHKVLAWRIPWTRGAWWATVHGVTKSQTQLGD